MFALFETAVMLRRYRGVPTCTGRHVEWPSFTTRAHGDHRLTNLVITRFLLDKLCESTLRLLGDKLLETEQWCVDGLRYVLNTQSRLFRGALFKHAARKVLLASEMSS